MPKKFCSSRKELLERAVDAAAAEWRCGGIAWFGQQLPAIEH
jgi:hypothetical protein